MTDKSVVPEGVGVSEWLAIEALKGCLEFIEDFKKNGVELLAEGVHAGLRKGSDAPDAGALWRAISESRTTAWGDAIAFAHDPFFSLWGGDEIIRKAKMVLAHSIQSGGEGGEG